MRHLVPTLVLTLAISAAACGGATPTPADAPASAPAAADVLVLNNFTLIDGSGGPAVADSALIATDGRITWIGPNSELKAPAGAPVQDLAGKFVMPGLIDLHTHVANSDVEMQDPVRFFTREGVTRDLQLYASYGVTSVASLGTDQKPLVYEMRAEQRKGRPTVARIFTAGRGFTVKDGFPTNKGNVPGIPYEPSTPSEAAAQMEELAAEHPDVVKIWVDDRFGDFKKTPIEISRPIMEGAHKHGIKVIAHVFYLSDAKELAAAGLDAFGHSVRDRAVDAELIQLMKERGTWIIPTLYREWATFMFEKPDQLLNDPFFARGLDARQQTVLKSPEYHKALTGDKYFPRYPTVLKNAKENLKRLADAGVRIGYGTDSGVLTRFEGFGEHMELELMVEAGMTPAQVITAATKSSAEFLGQQNDLGTLEQGKWADLVVLGANPLENIRNSRQIEAVYIAGNKVP
ncbi:MAG: amidohydrolase [Acidobacteria bacterium]|nr:MAG: amidohydrolase [Acidobacteriota bacterium]